jgi:hypothetical protein
MKGVTKFVARMQALFGAPGEGDYDAIVAEYANALKGQSDTTLNRAADIIARERKIRAWPTVAECLDAVSQARRVPNTVAMGLDPIDDFDGWWSERLARIGTATSEREISAQMSIIEPYHIARWISDSRMPEAIAVANARRREWQGQRTSDTTRRMTGGEA